MLGFICIGVIFLAFTVITDCNAPSSISNAEPYEVRPYAVGEALTISCKRAHALEGSLQSSASFYCTANGEFSLTRSGPGISRLPQCVKSKWNSFEERDLADLHLIMRQVGCAKCSLFQ